MRLNQSTTPKNVINDRSLFDHVRKLSSNF